MAPGRKVVRGGRFGVLLQGNPGPKIQAEQVREFRPKASPLGFHPADQRHRDRLFPPPIVPAIQAGTGHSDQVQFPKRKRRQEGPQRLRQRGGPGQRATEFDGSRKVHSGQGGFDRNRRCYNDLGQ